MIRKIVLALLLNIASLTFLWSQNNTANDNQMRMLVSPKPDSIMIRWAPTTYRLWLVGNKYGYRLTKTLMIKNGEFVKNRKAVMLSLQPIKPLPLKQWEKLDEKDEYAGVAAQAIYGNSFAVETGNNKLSILDIYNKATEQENRYSFALFAADMSVEVAKFHGLMFVDKDAKPGEKYLYKVYPDSVPADMQKDTAYYFTGVDEYLPLPSPADVKAEGNDGTVMLTWDNKYQADFFNSFWIERSSDGGKTFARLNKEPLINTTPEGGDDAPYNYYLDSIPNNYTTYNYRVIGISPFGELSPPSKLVETSGVDIITSIPRIIKKYSTDGKTVNIEWEFENINHNKVEGFRIFRSKEYSKGYTLLADSLSVISKLYRDKNPLSTGYYRMQAFNSHGSSGYSVPQMMQMVDSFPPAKPAAIRGVIDVTGVVKLHWNPNNEPDIDGYRIYRANGKHEEFTALVPEPFADTVFTDNITLKTLTTKVYYKIKAYDKSQNQSVFSEVLELDRPDIVPPASPLLKSITPTDTGIVISWVQSPSKDVEKTILYRNREGGNDWEVINVLSPSSPDTIVDKPQQSGYIYRYLMIAVDQSKNESKPTKPVAAKYNPTKPGFDWIKPKVKSVKSKKVVLLTWDLPPFVVKRFLIYARLIHGKWQLVDGVPGNVFHFESSLYYDKDMEFVIKPVL